VAHHLVAAFLWSRVGFGSLTAAGSVSTAFGRGSVVIHAQPSTLSFSY